MRKTTILSSLFLAFALASCGSDQPTTDGVTFESPTPGSAAAPAAESKILAFKAPKLGGGQVVGGDLQGKDVAVWFWAPW